MCKRNNRRKEGEIGVAELMPLPFFTPTAYAPTLIHALVPQAHTSCYEHRPNRLGLHISQKYRVIRQVPDLWGSLRACWLTPLKFKLHVLTLSCCRASCPVHCLLVEEAVGG